MIWRLFSNHTTIHTKIFWYVSPFSPSYRRHTSKASWKSDKFFTQTLTQSSSFPANKKNAAACMNCWRPIRTNAFFCAAVCQRSSSKLFLIDKERATKKLKRLYSSLYNWPIAYSFTMQIFSMWQSWQREQQRCYNTISSLNGWPKAYSFRMHIFLMWQESNKTFKQHIYNHYITGS